MENIKDIRRALYAATGTTANKTIKELASVYEDITLASEEFPDECLDLIVEILSSKELITKAGIDSFLLKISTDMYRLSASQKQRLLDAICSNYGQCEGMELCWLLGDLIARNYDRSSAMQAFRIIFNSSTPEGKKGVVLGLDILARQSKRDPRVMKEIETILGTSGSLSR